LIDEPAVPVWKAGKAAAAEAGASPFGIFKNAAVSLENCKIIAIYTTTFRSLSRPPKASSPIFIGLPE
jgi:hypothetical protein